MKIIQNKEEKSRNLNPWYLISNQKAIGITVSLLVVLGVSLYSMEYLSKTGSINYEVEQEKTRNSIDSIKAIQVLIARYDSLNGTDSIMELYPTLPSKSEGISNLSDIINIAKIQEEIKYQSIEQLEKGKIALQKKLDSQEREIAVLKIEMESHKTFFDSISPLYPMEYRISIQQQIEEFQNKWFLCSQKNIDRMTLNVRIFSFQLFFIKFSYFLFFLLFPIRWAVIYYHNRNRNT